MTTLTKVGIGLGTLGGVCGTGYVIKQQLTTEDTVLDIGVELIRDGYEILGNDATTEWEGILASYKETITDKPNLKFPILNGTVLVSDLQRACNEATKVNPSKNKDKDLYEKARLWCTKPRTLEDMLDKKGYKFLDTDSSASVEKDIQGWDKMLDKYKTSNESAKKFKGIELVAADSGASGARKDKTERNKLRDNCKPLKDKKHHKKDFAEELEKAELWCAIAIPK